MPLPPYIISLFIPRLLVEGQLLVNAVRDVHKTVSCRCGGFRHTLAEGMDVRYSQGENATAVARYTLAVDRKTVSCRCGGFRHTLAEGILLLEAACMLACRETCSHHGECCPLSVCSQRRID